MIHPIAAAAARMPDTVILRADGHDWTSAALEARIRARAAGLVAAGLQPGDRIGLYGPANADWLIAMHAIGWMGGVATPLAHGAPTEAALRVTKPTAVLTPDKTPLPHERVIELQVAAPDLCPPWTPSPDAEALCLTTSGTTGLPRAVPLSWGQIAASAEASAQRLGHRHDDVWLGCLPLHHIGGLSIFLRTARACTTALLHPGFDARKVAEALDTGTVTQVSLVPAMLRSVLNARPQRPFHPRLRMILIGGAPMPADLMARCQALELPIALTWGMTETASQIATRPPGDLRSEPDVGLPLPGTQVEVEEGFLVVTGPTVPGGRWRTADRGRLDADGRVIVQGRGTDLILSGGENVDPREVERALEAHPGVAEAAVVGRQDVRWGQRPVAFLVAAEAATPDAFALRQHLAQILPDFKHPDSYTWLKQLPRGPLGKLRRSALRSQAQTIQSVDER